MATRNETVDMVVAVHDVRRNIRRAIGSIVQCADPTIRAFVVAHNIDRALVEAELAEIIAAKPGRVRIEELRDGIPSPSGPFNFGMSTSDADLVGIMGSDDELDDGAIASWRESLVRHRADAVIAKVVRSQQRTLVRSPPKRLLRTGVLDFAKDRLSYRSAPLGLMRREAVSRLGLHLLDGARNGGDLPFVTKLWLRGRVVPARGQAGYVEHADAPVRVTYVAKPVREELGSVTAQLADPVIETMNRAQREALATKLIRRNLTDSVRKRDAGRGLSDDDLDAMRELLRSLMTIAPRALDLLSVAQRRMFDEILSPAPDRGRIAAADAASLQFSSAPAILPAKLSHVMHRQAQPRFMVATALIKVGASRFFDAARIAGAAVVVAAIVGVGVAVRHVIQG